MRGRFVPTEVRRTAADTLHKKEASLLCNPTKNKKFDFLCQVLRICGVYYIGKIFQYNKKGDGNMKKKLWLIILERYSNIIKKETVI